MLDLLVDIACQTSQIDSQSVSNFAANKSPAHTSRLTVFSLQSIIDAALLIVINFTCIFGISQAFHNTSRRVLPYLGFSTFHLIWFWSFRCGSCPVKSAVTDSQEIPEWSKIRRHGAPRPEEPDRPRMTVTSICARRSSCAISDAHPRAIPLSAGDAHPSRRRSGHGFPVRSSRQ